MNKFHLREFETKSGQNRRYKFAPLNRNKKPKLPAVKDPVSTETPPVFSDLAMASVEPLAKLNCKADPRIFMSRVVKDAESIDSHGGGGAHAIAAGHICRELGVTINGNVKTHEVTAMYAHNAPPGKDPEEEVFVPFENVGWDRNFVASGKESSE